MELQTTNIYSMTDVVEHLEMRGTLDFDAFYTVEVDECNEEASEKAKAWLLTFDDQEVWVAKSQSDYEAGNDTIDLKGWLLDRIVKEHFI